MKKDSEDIAALQPLSEWENRQDRKKNMIIFNLLEGADKSSDGKYKHDFMTVNE